VLAAPAPLDQQVSKASKAIQVSKAPLDHLAVRERLEIPDPPVFPDYRELPATRDLPGYRDQTAVQELSARRDWKVRRERLEQRAPVVHVATMEAPDFRVWLERRAELEQLAWKDLRD